VGMMDRISLVICNYYGTVEAYEEDGKFYIELDNWSEPDKKEISKEFYEAIIKEFDK
jgi:hypothetical protein